MTSAAERADEPFLCLAGSRGNRHNDARRPAASVDGPAPGTVYLFLGGDSALASERANRPPTISTLAGAFLPPAWFMKRSGPRGSADETDEGGGGFPSEQVMIAQIVLDTARKLGREVRIVDVNNAGAAQELVGRMVRPNDVLPVLARADGQRLVGSEAFTRSALKAFLSGT
jgi:hypothetical protein